MTAETRRLLEVEAALKQCDWIRSAVVLRDAGEDRAGRTVAYVVLVDPPGRRLIESLRAALPAETVPDSLVILDSLPLLAAGEPDVEQLARAHGRVVELAREYRAPQTSAERRLAAAWSEILDVERVGIDDNFFSLGGDSLHGVYIAEFVRRELRADLSVGDVLSHPTIRQLAALVSRAVLPGREAPPFRS